jgi:uncharacterized Rmd1/YagE family protein
MQVRALHLGEKFEIAKVQKHFAVQTAYNDPLVVEYGKSQYAAFLRYGVVVLWNFTDGEVHKFVSEVDSFLINKFQHVLRENLVVEITDASDKFESNQIFLKELTPAKVAVVSLVLGRSIALEHHENQVNKVFTDFDPFILDLEKHGRSNIPAKLLLKRAAYAMRVRHATLNQFSLLDAPDVTWDSQELFELYSKASIEYDIENRYKLLEKRLTGIFRDVDFILQILEGRKSRLLELTIVFLILIEILIFAYEIWFR